MKPFGERLQVASANVDDWPQAVGQGIFPGTAAIFRVHVENASMNRGGGSYCVMKKLVEVGELTCIWGFPYMGYP